MVTLFQIWPLRIRILQTYNYTLCLFTLCFFTLLFFILFIFPLVLYIYTYVYLYICVCVGVLTYLYLLLLFEIAQAQPTNEKLNEYAWNSLWTILVYAFAFNFNYVSIKLMENFFSVHLIIPNSFLFVAKTPWNIAT